jgi:hypothetical protein
MAESYAMRGAKLEAMAILDKYLAEVGTGPTDLRVPATIMRRRIADRMHPRAETIAGQSPLVGRSAEMERLGGLLELARQKKGQACLVWGDAGVGKSRLLAEFSAFASLQGVATQRVQCRPSDRYRPLSVFVDLVPGLRSLRGAIGCSPETFSFLDRLTTHKSRAERAEDQGDSEFVFSRVEQALFDLVDAVSDEKCVIVLVEDVHWLDAASAKLLQAMIEWAQDHSILFALTGRDEPGPSFRLLSNGFTEVHLAPLPVEASREVILALARAKGRDLRDEYLEWCVSVAEGNPYFLQELANQWVERGDEHAVPLSLSSLLSDRISRLHPDALLLLQTCSLLEKNSTLNRIEKILAFDPPRMLRAMDQLGNAGMLIVESAKPLTTEADRISSRHDLLSNSALSRLAAPAQAFLHRRIGLALEEEIAHDRSASILWDCAKHWQLAGDLGRAFQLAQSCATHLMDVGLPASAAEAFEKSLAYCSTADDRLSILSSLAQAYHRSNSWPRVRDIVSKAHALQQQLDPTASQHNDLELLGMGADWRSGITRLPIPQALTCLAATNASPEHRIQAGTLAVMMLDQNLQQESMAAAYSTIEELGDAHDINTSARLEARMVYHTVCGSLDIAVETARQMLASERQRANCGDLCRKLCNASRVLRTAGVQDEALALLLESETLSVKHNLPSARRRVLPLLGTWALERGDLRAAQDWYSKLLLADNHDETAFDQRDIAALGARLALSDGKVALARRRFAWNLDDVQRESTGQGHAYGVSILVAIELAAGSVSPAALEALEVAHIKARRGLGHAFEAVVLYEVLCAANREERAERLFTEYVERYRRERLPVERKLFEIFPGATKRCHVDRLPIEKECDDRLGSGRGRFRLATVALE